MKALRAALTALCLLASSGAYAAWSLVGTGTACTAQAGATCTPGMPTGHATGNHLLWIAMGRTSNVDVGVPQVPTDYTEIYSYSSATGKFFIVADKIHDGSESSPVVTVNGPTIIQMSAWAGGPASIVGLVHASNFNGGAACTTNPLLPGLTISQANTLVLRIAYQLDDYVTFTSSPAGFTTLHTTAYDGPGSADLSLMAAYQIQTTATTFGASNFVTAGAASSTCRGFALSLVPAAPVVAVSITSVDTDNAVTTGQTGRTAVVVDAGATQDTSTFKLIGQGGAVKVAQTLSGAGWGDTAIVFDVTQGNARFGPITWELVVGGVTATLAGALNAPSGEWFIDLTGLVALDFNRTGAALGRYRGQPNRYYDVPDLVNGDQLHCKRTGGTGTLTLNANGTFTAPSTITQIQCRKWHSNVWESFQTWDLRGAGPIFTGPDP